MHADPPAPPLPRTRSCLSLGLWIAALTLILDQYSKWLLLEVVDIDARPPMTLTPFFDLIMVWNRGISFGLFAKGDAWHSLLLSALALLIVAVLLVWLKAAASRWTAAGIGMIIGGAVGNVVDRARFGAVADFFSLHAGPYYWPAFNVADSAICLGVALLCVESMLAGRSTPQPPAS